MDADIGRCVRPMRRSDQIFDSELPPAGSEVRLVCRGLFPFLESSSRSISWTVDGQTLAELPDRQRFYNINK